MQKPGKPLEFKNEIASGEVEKGYADQASAQGEEGEDKDKETKGNWFSRMIAKQKERTQKELRAEEAAGARRGRGIQGGGKDGMLNREF